VKALLLLLLIVAGIWFWRQRQAGADTEAVDEAADDAATPPVAPAAPVALEMVRCQCCGVHLPGHEAVAGKNGPYCSAEHRQQSEP